MQKVVVVTVHPDDETLMCGGTLLKHHYLGDEINWLIITNVSEKFGWNIEFINKRQVEIGKVANFYGFNRIIKLDFPTTQLDTIPRGDLISKISDVFKTIKPEIIYLPNKSDVHSDHQITFEAAYSCTKSFRYPFIRKVLMGETLSESEFGPALKGETFNPNVFVDITDYIDKKKEIMRVYESEVMEPPFPRSMENIEALARYRGARAGVHFAEAFELLYEKA